LKKLIGIDLGGTSVKFAVLSFDGEIQYKWRIETNINNDGKNIVPSIIESIKENLEQYRITSNDILGIGMGSPGAINGKEGTVIGAYNLGWKTLQRVKEQIESAIGIPFYIDNDANVAALGELWKGAGEGDTDVIFVTLGTGIGGGVIVQGNLVHGASAAGELGHIIVDPDGYVCTCGNQGCLETVASATGIVRLAKDLAKEFKGDSSLKLIIDEGSNITSKMVFEQAKDDELARIVIDKFSYYLGLASGNIVNILNPNTIVIGGGVSAAGEMLIENVEKYFLKYTFPPLRSTTKLKLAKLGNEAGVIGAAWLVRKSISDIKQD